MNKKIKKPGPVFICDWEVWPWETFLVVQRKLWNRSENNKVRKKKATTWIIRFDCEVPENIRGHLTKMIKRARGGAQLRRKINQWKQANLDYEMEPAELGGL